MSPRAEHPLLCMQDEPGQVASFKRTVEALAGSLEVEAPSARAPRHAAIWEERLEGLPVGFTWERLYDEGDGSTTDVTASAGLLPVGPGELSASDGVAIHRHYPTGLAEATFVRFKNNEQEYRVELRRQGDKTYQYSGEVLGKSLSGTFRVEEGLFDDYDLIQRPKKATGTTQSRSGPGRSCEG